VRRVLHRWRAESICAENIVASPLQADATASHLLERCEILCDRKSDIPLPLFASRSIEIFELAKICCLIYGLQSVTGKILSRNNLVQRESLVIVLHEKYGGFESLSHGYVNIEKINLWKRKRPHSSQKRALRQAQGKLRMGIGLESGCYYFTFWVKVAELSS
jgi:hypothetical protein